MKVEDFVQTAEYHERACAICGKKFKTKIHRKQVCSYDCRIQRNRDNARIWQRKKRLEKMNNPVACTSPGCQFKFTETHHEGYGQIHFLCPSHHDSITRGLATLDQVLSGWPQSQ